MFDSRGVQFVKGRVMLDEVEAVYTFCEMERSFCLSGDNKF